jgi:hypothetical protein
MLKGSKMYPHPLPGKGLVFGIKNGVKTDATLTVEEVREMVIFPHNVVVRKDRGSVRALLAE